MKVKSRAKRFEEAVGKLRSAIDEARQALDGAFDEGKSELEELRDEYEGWKDNLPENLQSSTLGEKLDTIVDLLSDLDFTDEITSALDEAEGKVDELEGADLPLGFGRD